MLQLCSDVLLFTITYMIDRILNSLQLPWCYNGEKWIFYKQTGCQFPCLECLRHWMQL
jgi:hypothetical protein